MSGAEGGGDALVRSETENGNGDRSGDGDRDRETDGEDDAMVCDGPVFDRLMWNLLAPCQRGAEGREEEEGGKVLERRGETGSADEDEDEDDEEEEEEDSVPLGSALKGLGEAGLGTTGTETETETDVDAEAGDDIDAEADPNTEKDLVEKYEALDLRERRGEVSGRGGEGRGGDERRRGGAGE